MLKRSYPPTTDHLLLSNSETESDVDDVDDYVLQPKRSINRPKYIKKKKFKRSNNKEINLVTGESSTHHVSKKEQENEMMKRAKEYQEYMKQLPVPVGIESSSNLNFNTWLFLAELMKKKYKQPLHYLTLKLLKQWDESRARDDNDDIKPIGEVIDPSKAEASIWGIEEINRQFPCHEYIAKLWFADPNYHDFVDSIIPKY